MYFSLVLATVDRTTELERFLVHLDGQICRDFELIIVDQNLDDRLEMILEPYKARFPLVHLRTDQRGLSRARNLGIEWAKGEVMAFPDDDCWYPAQTLISVKSWLDNHPGWQGLTGRTVDARGKTSLGRFGKRSGSVNKYNIWFRMNSNTVFLRKNLVTASGKFDETLGVGAGTAWGSAEDIDFPLRAIQKNYKIYYDPEMIIGHPDPLISYDEAVLWRAYTYSSGMGRVFSMHRYPLWFVLYFLLRPLGGCLVPAIKGNRPEMKYHWNIYKGRLNGWRTTSNGVERKHANCLSK